MTWQHGAGCRSMPRSADLKSELSCWRNLASNISPTTGAIRIFRHLMRKSRRSRDTELTCWPVGPVLFRQIGGEKHPRGFQAPQRSSAALGRSGPDRNAKKLRAVGEVVPEGLSNTED